MCCKCKINNVLYGHWCGRQKYLKKKLNTHSQQQSVAVNIVFYLVAQTKTTCNNVIWCQIQSEILKVHEHTYHSSNLKHATFTVCSNCTTSRLFMYDKDYLEI